MRFAFVTLCLLLAAPAISVAQVPDRPYLAVQGHAETIVVPDLFPVEITLSDTSANAAASQALVEDLARKVLAATNSLGVKDADVEIGNLRVAPETRWDKVAEKNVFLGNEYERTFRIRLHRLSDLRLLVAKLPESRNLRIRTGGFERSDRDDIVRALRRQAIANARAAASDLAEGTGVRLGRLHNASDRPQGVNYYRGNVSPIDVLSVERGNVLTSEMIVQEGQITLSSDIYLVFEIQGQDQASR
jgi:uncharacterized protein YggE